MSVKQTVILFSFFALFIGYGWYTLLTVPSLATDVYSPRTRLMLLVPATVIWIIAAGLRLYQSIGASKA